MGTYSSVHSSVLSGTNHHEPCSSTSASLDFDVTRNQCCHETLTFSPLSPSSCSIRSHEQTYQYPSTPGPFPASAGSAGAESVDVCSRSTPASRDIKAICLLLYTPADIVVISQFLLSSPVVVPYGVAKSAIRDFSKRQMSEKPKKGISYGSHNAKPFQPPEKWRRGDLHLFRGPEKFR
ncbi:hypothetical protein BR93DRAFT_671699 [Coniochaeta sp. PMI_546]|nr:hypothetical protein BR93DRAFT_671699 [Coniochaeta sp. PMI_546]